MKPDFRRESLKRNYNFGIIFFAFFILDAIKKNRENYPKKAIDQRNKETLIKI